MSLQQEENAMHMHSSPIRRRAPRVVGSAQFVAASSLVRNNVVSRFTYSHVILFSLFWKKRLL
jgi:hypothetical protein